MPSTNYQHHSMKKPPYIKIPAAELSADQFTAVSRELLPKFGAKLPSQLTGSFAFDPTGETFIGVWFA